MAYRRTRPCIICGVRDGAISTADGYVCEECMPADLVPEASSLRRSRLVIYRKTHPDWESCAERWDKPAENPCEACRSRAITQESPPILCDALNESISDAESVDLAVSFIRSSGLNLLIDRLREAAEAGCVIRVITTAYMGFTEYEAVMELAGLPNSEVRMELNAGASRFHAKCYLFTSPDGKGTAYVGSANITRSALTSGEEWMVAIREDDLPMVVDDLRRAYGKLWESPYLTRVDDKNRAKVEMALERRGK